MKEVSSLWIGDSISDLEKLCIKSFIDHGYSYNLFTYTPQIKNLPPDVTLKNGSQILSKDKIFQYKSGFNKGSVSGFSNLFRYKLLYENGGIWVDTDLALLKPNLNFEKQNVFTTEVGEPPDGKFASALIKAQVGCPVLKECLKEFKKVNVDKVQHGETGPELVTQKLNETGLKKDNRVGLKSRKEYFPVYWEDTERIFYDEIDIKERWRTLHFCNAWITNELNLNKNGSFPHWSIYERLKSKYLNA